MTASRREFLMTGSVSATGLLLLSSCKSLVPGDRGKYEVPKKLQDEMYQKALAIAKSRVRGGEKDPFYKKPFVDAAFSSNIFYWDTCFIAAYAKYHQQELPINNALDNFYNLMEPDGFICREYTKEGKPMWSKDHPVSVNPPLLAFAELELYSVHHDKSRLESVYPLLKRHFDYWIKNYRGTDQLFFNDALGSGMDNIDRFPRGWQDDHSGIPIKNIHPEIFAYGGPGAAWNQQGRMVDISAQMALFAKNLIEMASLINETKDIPRYSLIYDETRDAVNRLCWNEEDGFYYDLGYSKQIKRKHIGMFWVLLAEIIPRDKLDRFLSHLVNPREFWRTIPVATLSADDSEFSPAGNYWKGSVWAPTNYMILRGLMKYGQKNIARRLARQYYWAVAEVYRKTGTFWENYAPDSIDKGNDSRPDFCGWTGLVPIAIYREFVR